MPILLHILLTIIHFCYTCTCNLLKLVDFEGIQIDQTDKCSSLPTQKRVYRLHYIQDNWQFIYILVHTFKYTPEEQTNKYVPVDNVLGIVVETISVV